MITIIDYDAGNIRSVANMLRVLGTPNRISSDPAEIARADKLILPGVGHFDHGMGTLEQRGLIEALNQRVLREGVPLLGICLGAQLLTRSSEEGARPGLGWIDGRAVAFDRTRMDRALRVPHMGWANTWTEAQGPLFTDLPDDARFYYVHSFHIVCDDPTQAILTAQHGYPFTAGVQQDNIVGVQFHPEKSHRFGMQVLRNFIDWRPDAKAAA